MCELVSLWNSYDTGYDVVAILLVNVVICCGFMVLVLCLRCNMLKFWLCL